MPASQQLLDLAGHYRDKAVEFGNLKGVTLAGWILESGWGQSELARKHNNFAGMKYRPELKRFAKKVRYQAHDGVDDYCAFETIEAFIDGYWAFLDRAPYRGWRDRAADPAAFIGFVGPIWSQDGAYVGKVLGLIERAQAMLEDAPHPGPSSEPSSGHVCDGCGTGEIDVSVKPTVNRWEQTSHQSSRNGADIDHIVIHYTTSRNIEGTISHFKRGTPRTSAHYIVGRDGALVQMVNDSDRAWHAGNVAMNARSVGIEHVAGPGDRITPQQAATAAALIGWLMQEYEIPRENVIPHVCVKSTSCCGDLFAADGGRAGGSCEVQTAALRRWMEANGL